MRDALSRPVLRFALALAAVAFIPCAASAQVGKITGLVTDAGTGQPLEGVQVFLQGTGYGNITNASGRYFMLSVPPGTYTVVARRIGYQTAERTNVQVLIDVTRTVNFEMQTATTTLGPVTVRAEAAPLIEPGQTGSSIPITAEQISALPVTSIEGALSLQQGFIQAPNSTDLISFNESRRNAENPRYIRGGRQGETLQLIDGIPVQNFIFGGPALSISPLAVQQVDFLKGGMGPEYGNALSGVINIATKEGGTDLAGELKYQTSSVGGALGNEQDDLRGYNLVEGFLSGPVPGTAARLRFMVSGRQELQSDAVHEFDDDFFQPSSMPTGNAFPFLGPNLRDIIPGWRAFGYNNTRQVFGKLAFLPWAERQGKLTFTLLDNQKQRQPFDPQYLLTYGSALNSPAVRNTADSIVYYQNLAGSRLDPLGFERTVQGSIGVSQRLYAANWDHALGRSSYRITAGTFRTRRETCNYFQGVCLRESFADPNFTDDQFISPLNATCTRHPTCGADEFFGGERLNTLVLRGDARSQVTDHHEISGGLLYQRYDFRVNVTQNVGTNEVNVYRQQYANEPYDVGVYLQDRIEYDFITLKLGARFDYGAVPGTFFADPLDPTNGTTAVDVCNNPTDPRWARGTRFGFIDENGVRTDTLLVPDPAWAPAVPGGPSQCSAGDFAVAGRIASFDDFARAKARKQFSPRIGVSFPLSQSSSVFFNFGRFSQNPLLNNLLTNTGIGTPREGLTVGPVIEVPGEGGPGIIGNPNLRIEQSTTYEMGYNAEFARVFALGLTLFNKNQSGLTGIRTGGQRLGLLGYEQVFDPGTTYGSSNTPSYSILVNQDFQTVRGMEVQLRRRVANYWGFDLNYSYSRARTNASEPEREFERQVQQGDPQNLFEVPSDIDQAHVFNATLTARVGDQTPSIPLGGILRNLTASVTFKAASGFPYTPQIDFFGFGLNQLQRNTARAPSSSSLDMLLRKGFRVANVRYEAFVQGRNMLDRMNCVQVFASTGTCFAGTIDQSRRRQGNQIQPDEVTSTFLNRADFVGARREITGGLRVSF